MTEIPEYAIRINTEPTNPGQFFACCGLLELADRLWVGAEGWFDDDGFWLRAAGASLPDLVNAIAGAPLNQLDADDDCSSPVELRAPFNLRMDWWKDDHAGGDRLKVWAGSMRAARIARAMQSVLAGTEFHNEGLLDRGLIVYDPSEPDKKVEPYYFDARRGSCAQAIDVGFSPDAIQMTSVAYPAVEFLCLAGLQRFRPWPTGTPRVFDYYAWRLPLTPPIAALAACGLVFPDTSQGFRFENAFRTDQRKHKAFTSATRFRKENE